MGVFAFKLLEWITQARTATHFTAFGIIAGVVALEIYATPANQTSYITDVHVSLSNNVAAAVFSMDIRDAGNVIQHRIPTYAHGGAVGGDTKNVFYTFQLPRILPAGWDIVMNATHANTDVYMAVEGWVE